METFELDVNDVKLYFNRVELRFDREIYSEVFRLKNNKTLKETLQHRRYVKFKYLKTKYSDYLEYGLGDFLGILKDNEDPTYKLFLNKYGDLEYSIFRIFDTSIINKKGLYIYIIDDNLKYIGRCLDNFKKRINQGYGKIHPKNCFIDGQATNCHLNSLITKNRDFVNLLICPLNDDENIIQYEKKLINKIKPEWNLI